MICTDTSYLIDLWRHNRTPDHPSRRVLADHAGDVFVVPAVAVGEFLEGAVFVSEERLQESQRFLAMFRIGLISNETAVQYARAVAELRSQDLLRGMSKFDPWIAAWALQHGAKLVTTNVRHYERVPGLDVIRY